MELEGLWELWAPPPSTSQEGGEKGWCRVHGSLAGSHGSSRQQPVICFPFADKLASFRGREGAGGGGVCGVRAKRRFAEAIAGRTPSGGQRA